MGFRWFVREGAKRLGLTGWVRNLPNGEVEFEAQGGAEELRKLVAFLKKGHPYARVDAIEETVVAAVKDEAGFDIR